MKHEVKLTEYFIIYFAVCRTNHSVTENANSREFHRTGDIWQLQSLKINVNQRSQLEEKEYQKFVEEADFFHTSSSFQKSNECKDKYGIGNYRIRVR